jgi:hypothetical protein
LSKLEQAQAIAESRDDTVNFIGGINKSLDDLAAKREELLQGKAKMEALLAALEAQIVALVPGGLPTPPAAPPEQLELPLEFPKQ